MSADEPSRSESIGIDHASIEYEAQFEAEAEEHRRLELRQDVVRAAAHATMPSTMYASTPSDPLNVPHLIPELGSFPSSFVDEVMPRYLASVEEANARPFSERLQRVMRTVRIIEQSRRSHASLRDTTRPQHLRSDTFNVPVLGKAGFSNHLVIPYFPSSSDPSGRQGMLRVINRSPREGTVTIQAIDEVGTPAAPIEYSINAASVLHVNSVDLEYGNLAKGSSIGTGAGQGTWVLALSSTVAIEVHAYIQTPDGYVTSINGVVTKNGDDAFVAYFRSTDDSNPQELLRLVNLNAVPAKVAISRAEELSTARGSVTVELAPYNARTYSVDDLVTGAAPGISGFLKDAHVDTRLAIESPPGVRIMNFKVSDGGYLTNLSNLSMKNGIRDVPLFLSTSDPSARQGLVRVVNKDHRPGTVGIQAIDDAGRVYEPLSLSLDAYGIAEVSSNDLELGNTLVGLSGSTGPGDGNWRLNLSSELNIDVFAFVKTPDGLATPIQDTVARMGNRHEVTWFKAIDDSDRIGLLRLINRDEYPAHVEIRSLDDRGERQGTVRLTVAPRASRMLTVMELETGGENLHGSFGDGFGEWRLTITSDVPIDVMNLLSTPTGHLTNLSTAASVASDDEEETAESLFESTISGIIMGDCINCHVFRGFAQNSRLVFVTDGDPEHLSKNLNAFRELLGEVENGAELVLNRIQGVDHPPGERIRAGTDEFAAMERFLELLGGPVTEAPAVSAESLFDGVATETDRLTLRRAAIVFAGRVPTDEEFAALRDDGDVSLRTAIRGLMQGPGFHNFIIRASNDRLFTDRDFRIVDDDGDGFVDYARELYNAGRNGRAAYNEFKRQAQYGFRREPLELIAHIAENDLPYTEILTADYVMANPMTASSYGAETEFTNTDDPHEFKPSAIVNYYRRCDGYAVERSDLGYLVVDPGPCSTEYPHAGLLNTKVFMQRYPTTATNRNRARSRWTYYHFLGFDIEKSASRTTDPVALADTNNPTLGNPACTVCHTVLDPVAGAYQNYGDRGSYRDQRGGMDALDRFYKFNPSGRNDISVAERSQADSVISLGSVQLFADRDNELGLKNQRTFEGDRKLHIGLGQVTVTAMNGEIVHQYEVGDVVQEEDCGSSFDDGYRLWDCQKLLPLPLAVTETGEYEVSVEAWIIEEGTAAGTLLAWMPGPFYRDGDTWYRDMREPGFGEEKPDAAHNSVQWLAQRIVADERFAEATVEFWWPAIMGSEVIEPPEDGEDASSDATLLASNAQSLEIARLANGFREGFDEGEPFNLKDLLVEIALSPWFRAVSIESDDELQRSALAIAGARRLLTPAELASKTLDLTGFQWGRYRDQWWFQPHEERLSSLTDPTRGYGLLYGGIDSDGVLERARDLTSTMAGVAQSHASESSCPIVVRELFLLPDEDRLLFEGFDRRVTPTWEFGETFKIDAAAWADRETLSQTGDLSVGTNKVAMFFTNNYDDADGDRNVRLYEFKVVNADGEAVHEASLKDLEPPTTSSGTCGVANAFNDETEENDHFNLHSSCSAAFAEFSIEMAGSYTVEVVAWADQHGEDLAELEIVVQSNTESSAGASLIREQLVRLYDRLHGIDVDADSSEVQGAYDLFVEVWEANLASDRATLNLRPWRDIQCDWTRDQYFLDGILEDAWVFREDWGDDRGPRHDWDWDHISAFLGSVDFSDRQGAGRTWVVAMTYMLMDYRYLYL